MQVTPAGDGFYCEFDGKTYDTMERRYVLLLRAADFSGEAYLNMFNEQVHDCSCSPYGVDFSCDRPHFSQLEPQANFTVDAGGCSPLSISTMLMISAWSVPSSWSALLDTSACMVVRVVASPRQYTMLW